MAQRSETQTTAIKIRQKRSIGPVEQLTSVEDVKKKRFRADQLLKNTGMAAALVLCAVTLRTGAFPTLDPAADVVLAAATDNSLLDDQLGKLIHRIDVNVGRILCQKILQDGMEDVSGTNGRIIRFLSDHENEDVYQRDLEREFGITRSTASRVLTLMEHC